MVTECCSESRMRSRTSRGVPEWSGGKDLYMGSPVLVTGKVSGDIGIVPGPPGGSRGSTKWGHLPQKVAWAKCGRGPAPRRAGAPPTRVQGARESGRGQTLVQMGLKAHIGAPPSPLPSWPPPPLPSRAAAPLGVGTLEGAHPPPSPLYIVRPRAAHYT